MLKDSPSIGCQSQRAYLVADYAERACLANEDFDVDLDSLFERRNNHDIENDIDVPSEDVSACDDKRETEASDIANLLRSRQDRLGDLYPFNITGDERIIFHRDSTKTDIYVFFLLCSSFNYLAKSDQIAFANEFEKVCVAIVRKIFPHFQTEGFGTASSNNILTESHVWDRFTSLCGRLGTSVRGDVTPRRTNSGDFGLDIVSWFHAHEQENASHMPCIFAQCACTSDEAQMIAKQSDYQKATGKIDRLAPPLLLHFTPHCYRGTDGQWHDPSQIRTAFFDRLRLLLTIQSLEIYENVLAGLPPAIRTKIDMACSDHNFLQGK